MERTVSTGNHESVLPSRGKVLSRREPVGGTLGLAGALAAMLTACLFRVLRGVIVSVGYPLVWLGYRLRVNGLSHVPQRGGALLVCNHASYLDPILIQAALGRFVRFMMFRPYYEKLWLKIPCRVMKVVPISGADEPRELLRSLRQVRTLIRAGEVVCIFAEGGVTRTGRMGEFQRGVEVVMKGLDAPVIPMALSGMWGTFMSFYGGCLMKRLPFREPVALEIGVPMAASSSVAAIEARVRALAVDAAVPVPDGSVPAGSPEGSKGSPRVPVMWSRRVRGAVALSLLLPVVSFGTWIGLWVLPGQTLGRVLYFATKLWTAALPLVWRLGVERRPLSLSPLKRGGMGVGILLGAAISAGIVLAYVTLGPWLLVPAEFVRMGAANGLANGRTYLIGALYWITVNSLLEEMIWRWFAVERFEDLGLKRSAIWLSALGFTVHHVIALRVYCSWPATLLCSLGIIVGGVSWSVLFRRYRSVWPGYISHAIVDVCVFALGWILIHAA